MTTEEQRDYWEEQYQKQFDRNVIIIKDLKELLQEMRKHGSNYYGDKVEKIINL